MSGTFQLGCHLRSDLPPTEHPDAVRQLEHRAESRFATDGRKGQKRPRERSACSSDYRLAQAQIPVPGREHTIVGPGDFATQQSREGLIVDEDRQSLTDLSRLLVG